MTRFLCISLPLMFLLAACGGTETTPDDMITGTEEATLTPTVEYTTDVSPIPVETPAGEQATPQPDPTATPSSPGQTPEPEPTQTVDLEALLLTRDILGDWWAQMVTEEHEGTEVVAAEDEDFLCGYPFLNFEVETEIAYSDRDSAFVYHRIFESDADELAAFMDGLPQAITDCEPWEDDDGVTWTVETMIVPVLRDASAGFFLTAHDPAWPESASLGMLVTSYGNIMSITLYWNSLGAQVPYGTFDVAQSIDFIVSQGLDRDPFAPALGDTVQLTSGATITMHDVNTVPNPDEWGPSPDEWGASHAVVVDVEFCAGLRGMETPDARHVSIHPVIFIGFDWAQPWQVEPYQEHQRLEPGACHRGQVALAIVGDVPLASVSYEVSNPGIGSGPLVHWWLEQEPPS
jgi:hypothetical protein